MNKEQKISAGLAFMQAAAAAMPKTLGDRERIAAFSGAMTLAVRNRFAFAKDDAKELLRMGIETCVGVFRPLDYYLGACVHGGTYARMWEAHHGQKPWVARKAIAPRYAFDHYRTTILDDNRVATGMGVLLPQSFDAPDSFTLPVQGLQVWWVTSQTDEIITVCRYRLNPSELEKRHADTPFQRTGHPFRIRKLTREQWKELNAEPVEEQQAA
ncbi:hypothetical protein [Burkholderia ubonensis]|uniref:hypothetical protein n=1 Tax=Burkholderia ubonensis TaxID=101571 RepID=UPI00075535E0|nr:hypothetical protein [Burkholderia ubonensis]KVP16883.1 hypothetical protein WJ84_01000 [Burkholderia ubonensis]KVP39997.1 hypothetical protein WJ87_07385 [Burkholderia ubonensis]